MNDSNWENHKISDIDQQGNKLLSPKWDAGVDLALSTN